MVGDGKAVGLVADLLEQVQGFGRPRDAHGVGPARQVHLLELLGEGGHRDLLLQPQLLEDPQGDAELTLAAVHEQQLRGVSEATAPIFERLVPFGQVGAQAAGQDLAHGRVVVVLVDGADLEAPVLLGLGQPVLHHHHAPDVVGALEMTHVVALDA